MRPPVLRLVLVPAVLLVACSGNTGPHFAVPSSGSLRDGTCSVLSDDLRALGRAGNKLGDGGAVDQSTLDQLTAAQKGLKAVAEGAEADLQPALDTLVTRAGLVRVAAAVSRYVPERDGRPLAQAYAAVVKDCTRR